jgi:hypothetical protein
MYAQPPIQEELFQGAESYRQGLEVEEVHETSGAPFTERHLHALWYDARLRPQRLVTSRGEPVSVENPGRWNLEAGPDFLGAVVRIGREARRMAGDAELHLHPADWKHHRHQTDPRYAGVRFHITWFPGPPAEEALFPPGTLHLALAEVCTADLDSIDLAAYPYAAPLAARFPLAGSPPDRATRWLEAAGLERLRQKTRRMAWVVAQRGAPQALYEECAAALGYKYNKAPFRRLAQELSLERLAPYGTDWKTIYAVLLGLSGLLPRQPGTDWPDDAKQELRALWDRWWREQHKWEELAAPQRSDWRLAGVRPLNHPVRRLCALAQWAASGLFAKLEQNPAVDASTFLCPDPCFWSTRAGWSSREQPAEPVGNERARAILLNVILPFRLMRGDRTAPDPLPAESSHSVLRETACALFGPDHSPRLYRSALARQGLLQVFNDWVLTNRLHELSPEILPE